MFGAAPPFFEFAFGLGELLAQVEQGLLIGAFPLVDPFAELFVSLLQVVFLLLDLVEFGFDVAVFVAEFVDVVAIGRFGAGELVFEALDFGLELLFFGLERLFLQIAEGEQDNDDDPGGDRDAPWDYRFHVGVPGIAWVWVRTSPTPRL